MLQLVPNEALKLVWDPANALVVGEVPFPSGYRLLPTQRIVHVHAKDCRMQGERPEWGPLGTRYVDWEGQIEALLADGYKGASVWRRTGLDRMGTNGKRAGFVAGIYAGSCRGERS
jgi:sugar phosphate isomerase/epimerase